MLMVGHANTNPGLTKTWDTGEPDKYYPSGTRNYARVVTTDDYQGVGAASVRGQRPQGQEGYVLNDNQTYGLGVAQGVRDDAAKSTASDRRRPVLGRQAAELHRALPGGQGPGRRLVYLGGIYDNNGGQLVKDKVAVLGDNTERQAARARRLHRLPGHAASCRVDGDVPDLRRSDQDQLVKAGGAGAKLLDAYKAKYGKAPDGSYPLYGVAAVQVILAAIAKSDGTRKSVTGGAQRRRDHIPAGQSVIGKEIKIDPTTGDTSAKDITVEIVKDGKETFVKAQTVS